MVINVIFICVSLFFLGTMFIFRLEAGQISIVVVVGENLFNNTEGLLGIYDSDQNNDLKIREGRTLPLNSSSETIYNEFGESCKFYSQLRHTHTHVFTVTISIILTI